jgi:hypothetical protein
MEDKTPKSKSNVVYIIIIVMLVLAVAALTYVYKHQYQKLESINAQIDAQRDSIGKQLNQMIIHYDSIKTENTAIAAELDHEKKKIRALIRKMYNAEQISLETIRQYENETATLRSIMRHYLVQIDSLNNLSQRLLAENKEVKKTLNTYKEENKELSEHKTVLEQKVKKASVLKISALTGGGLNGSDKDVTNANRTKKLKGCFIINENAIVESGERTIYVRFINPESGTMLGEASGEFEINGERMQYSAKRDIDYQGEALETCVYFAVPKDMKLSKGQYEVQVYIDGGLAGNAGFILKGGLF